MKPFVQVLAVALVVGAVIFASQPKNASAQIPYSVTYTYRAPTTVYYASPPVVSVARPTVVYRPLIAAPTTVYSYSAPTTVYSVPTTVYSVPAPVTYVAPSATVVQYRGPLGLFPRRAVVYSSGGVYSPAFGW